jgi:hypothetical protein
MERSSWRPKKGVQRASGRWKDGIIGARKKSILFLYSIFHYSNIPPLLILGIAQN